MPGVSPLTERSRPVWPSASSPDGRSRSTSSSSSSPVGVGDLDRPVVRDPQPPGQGELGEDRAGERVQDLGAADRPGLALDGADEEVVGEGHRRD